MNNSAKSNSELNNLRNKLNKDIKNIYLTSNDEQENTSKNLINIKDIKPNTEVFVTNLGQNGIILSLSLIHISEPTRP